MFGRQRTLSPLLVIMLGLAACALTRETPVPPAGRAAAIAGTSVGTLTSSGEERHYRLHVPPNAGTGQALPLVINLHGYNSNAEQQELVSQMSAKADAAGFVAVYPEGLGDPQSWHFGTRAEAEADVQFMRDLVQTLEKQLAIDPRRIYVTGISNGAEMSYRLMCVFADTAAAFALVSGGYPPFPECQPARPVPVVVFHGTDDQLLPYEGHPPLLLPVRQWAEQWAARNGCAASPNVTLQRGDVTGEAWPNCHDEADVVLYTINGKGHSWPGSNMPARITTRDISATDVIWDFFVAHPRPQT
jgi:polyhydroxybutyrate depolymerase